ncbi:hypothetical protein HF086_015228 [Spodoptera exigua]|uniref:NADH-cytochrome b5 reductase n=1 Tax=Spodoptera exigua TaxID=7107 RepID=A0A922M900_SPOEX|nr:hypothetical protein HF086_015228 [Spodoptera exigua]
MEKPDEPNSEDCCNSGCNPCIFDIYEEQLKLYKKYLMNKESVNVQIQNNAISQLKYTEFVLVKIIPECHLHHHLLFKKKSEDNTKVFWKPGDHFLYKYTTDKYSCTRAYTPLNICNEQSLMSDFSIIVKKYEHGIVSSHLCNLKEGSITFWRGPYGHYNLECNKFERIIMIAQGTGIAPFISIIETILNNEDDFTRLILIYCCKGENSILFREKLYSYKSYWNFKYEIYVSNTSISLKCRYHEPIKSHRFNKDNLLPLKPYKNNDQVLICGTPEFNETYKLYFEAENPKVENIVLF